MLAADLERFLNHEPIVARPISWPERSLRWVRRNKGLAATGTLVLLVLVVVAVGSLAAAAYFRRLERNQSDLVLQKSRLIEEKEAERQKAVEAEAREAGLRKVAERANEELRANLYFYFARMNLIGQAATSSSGIGRIDELLMPWEPVHWEQGRPDLRQWEWYYLKGLCHREDLILTGHAGAVLDAAWSPDDKTLASGGTDGTLRIWDAVDGRNLMKLEAHRKPILRGGLESRWNSPGLGQPGRNDQGLAVAERRAAAQLGCPPRRRMVHRLEQRRRASGVRGRRPRRKVLGRCPRHSRADAARSSREHSIRGLEPGQPAIGLLRRRLHRARLGRRHGRRVDLVTGKQLCGLEPRRQALGRRRLRTPRPHLGSATTRRTDVAQGPLRDRLVGGLESRWPPYRDQQRRSVAQDLAGPRRPGVGDAAGSCGQAAIRGLERQQLAAGVRGIGWFDPRLGRHQDAGGHCPGRRRRGSRGGRLEQRRATFGRRRLAWVDLDLGFEHERGSAPLVWAHGPCVVFGGRSRAEPPGIRRQRRGGSFVGHRQWPRAVALRRACRPRAGCGLESERATPGIRGRRSHRSHLEGCNKTTNACLPRTLRASAIARLEPGRNLVGQRGGRPKRRAVAGGDRSANPVTRRAHRRSREPCLATGRQLPGRRRRRSDDPPLGYDDRRFGGHAPGTRCTRNGRSLESRRDAAGLRK